MSGRGVLLVKDFNEKAPSDEGDLNFTHSTLAFLIAITHLTKASPV